MTFRTLRGFVDVFFIDRSSGKGNFLPFILLYFPHGRLIEQHENIREQNLLPMNRYFLDSPKEFLGIHKKDTTLREMNNDFHNPYFKGQLQWHQILQGDVEKSRSDFYILSETRMLRNDYFMFF